MRDTLANCPARNRDLAVAALMLGDEGVGDSLVPAVPPESGLVRLELGLEN